MSRLNSIDTEKKIKVKQKPLSLLNEILKRHSIKPQYEFSIEQAPGPKSLFTFEVNVNGLKATGSAFKKSDAKQEAAENMLNQLGHEENLKFLKEEWQDQQKPSIPLLGELLTLKTIEATYKKLDPLLSTSSQIKLIRFEITAGELTTTGSGLTKQEAKQAAAENMLKLITKNGDEIFLTKTKPLIGTIPSKFMENYVSCLETLCIVKQYKVDWSFSSKSDSSSSMFIITCCCNLVIKHESEEKLCETVAQGKSIKFAKHEAAKKMLNIVFNFLNNRVDSDNLTVVNVEENEGASLDNKTIGGEKEIVSEWKEKNEESDLEIVYDLREENEKLKSSVNITVGEFNDEIFEKNKDLKICDDNNEAEKECNILEDKEVKMKNDKDLEMEKETRQNGMLVMESGEIQSEKNKIEENSLGNVELQTEYIEVDFEKELNEGINPLENTLFDIENFGIELDEEEIFSIVLEMENTELELDELDQIDVGNVLKEGTKNIENGTENIENGIENIKDIEINSKENFPAHEDEELNLENEKEKPEIHSTEEKRIKLSVFHDTMMKNFGFDMRKIIQQKISELVVSITTTTTTTTPKTSQEPYLIDQQIDQLANIMAFIDVEVNSTVFVGYDGRLIRLIQLTTIPEIVESEIGSDRTNLGAKALMNAIDKLKKLLLSYQ